MPKAQERIYASDTYEYNPQSGGVDWRARFMARLALEQSQMPQAVRYRRTMEDGDIYDVEVTPDTGGVCWNLTDDNLDCYWVMDIRDQSYWVMFRDEIEPDHFEFMTTVFGRAGIQMQTELPLEWVANVYMNRAQSDLSRADGVPIDWIDERPPHNVD